MTNVKKGNVLVLVMVAILAVCSVASAAYVYESRYGHNTLKRGHTGTYVTNLQTDINASKRASCGTPDGIFGSGTESGVKKYQTAKGLTSDGQAGYNTKMALWGESTTPN